MADKPSDYARNVVTAKLYGLVGSSIEAVLGQTLFASLNSYYEHWTCRVWTQAEYDEAVKSPIRDGGCLIALVPQFKFVEVGRVDFAILIPALDKKNPLLAIECDGHPFHERTPDQASRDKRRDRALVSLGIPTLRFTGTDLLRDCPKAVAEISEILDRRADELESRWWLEIGNRANAEHPPSAPAGMFVPYQWPRTRTDKKL